MSDLHDAFEEYLKLFDSLKCSTNNCDAQPVMWLKSALTSKVTPHCHACGTHLLNRISPRGTRMYRDLEDLSLSAQ